MAKMNELTEEEYKKKREEVINDFESFFKIKIENRDKAIVKWASVTRNQEDWNSDF